VPKSPRSNQGGTVRKAAVDFWFAVQRMTRRRADPPARAADYYPAPDADDSDEGSARSGVPPRPLPSSGSAGATAPGTEDET
jgi:hypothetical protein